MVLSKHGYADLDNRAEAESHTRNLAVQSLPFGRRKLPTKKPFNLADRIAKLAILILIRHIRGSFLVTATARQ